MFYPRGGRPRLIIHKYAVTFSGRGFGRVDRAVNLENFHALLGLCRGLWKSFVLICLYNPIVLTESFTLLPMNVAYS